MLCVEKLLINIFIIFVRLRCVMILHLLFGSLVLTFFVHTQIKMCVKIPGQQPKHKIN